MEEGSILQSRSVPVNLIFTDKLLICMPKIIHTKRYSYVCTIADTSFHAKSVRHLATEISPLSHGQERYVSREDRVKADLADLLREKVPHSCFIFAMDGKTLADVAEAESTVATKCPPSPLEIAISLDHPAEVSDLMKSMALDCDQVASLQAATVEQSDCEQWIEQRKGRITASNFHRVHTKVNTLKIKSEVNTNSLVQQLMGYGRTITTVAMKHGKTMEPHAKTVYTCLQRRVHSKFHSNDSCLFVNPVYPFLAASPDLLIKCSCKKVACCGEGLCEIKCPESIKDQIPSPDNYKHLTANGLSKTSPYYIQVQGQMALSKRHYCDFFIYTHHGHHLERIQFDGEYWSTVQESLVYFGNSM